MPDCSWERGDAVSARGEAALSLSAFPVAGDWESCLLWEQMATSPPILSGMGRQPKPSLKEQSVTCSKENRKEHFFKQLNEALVKDCQGQISILHRIFIRKVNTLQHHLKEQNKLAFSNEVLI